MRKRKTEAPERGAEAQDGTAVAIDLCAAVRAFFRLTPFVVRVLNDHAIVEPEPVPLVSRGTADSRLAVREASEAGGAMPPVSR